MPHACAASRGVFAKAKNGDGINEARDAKSGTESSLKKRTELLSTAGKARFQDSFYGNSLSEATVPHRTLAVLPPGSLR